ncbi:NAD-dependent epimerase/dehydratase family protein [Lachnoclostridium sp. Marseille-P6806]|uniref:NAD-dependent epimerase/dehydratase family protein n=1 Tax=Lachnoclostridium sp. Marseille-P6806 TaxID=2364793 RepID=UPI0010316EE2|nr:NAD(P)-dependent oxidoreductase [Lachnoclostridium sp. Marseille-P6806]
MRNILESPNDPWLQEDLERLAASDLPLQELEGRAVLVTGATGLIGSQTVRALAAVNRLRRMNIRILALVRNIRKAEQIFGDLLQRGDIYPVIADLTAELTIAAPIDYIIHCAAVTASKTMVTRPVETIGTALDGTRSILELAREKNVAAFCYLSSMEVYGQWDGSRMVTEDVMGYVDPLVVRSNYPMSKRMCENLCACYRSEYGVNVRIARLAQTFGAGVLPGENRVFAQFARAVMRGEDIVLHTAGQSEGNYCYTADTVRALLTILLRGESGQAYNVSNEAAHTTIAGMADFAARVLAEGRIRVVFDIPETNTFGYAADTKMTLSSAKLRALGWEPEYSLEDCYRRLMGSLACQEQGQ